MSPPLGKFTSERLVTDQLFHTNRTGVGKISLSIITEGSKEFAIGGSQTFGCSGSFLDDTTNQPNVTQFNQATATISIWVHFDWNISIAIMEICTEVRRGVFGRISNGKIGMNPPRTIIGISPQVTNQGILNLFNPIRGTSNFLTGSCHGIVQL